MILNKPMLKFSLTSKFFKRFCKDFDICGGAISYVYGDFHIISFIYCLIIYFLLFLFLLLFNDLHFDND